MKSSFFSIEGLDGCGKSELQRAIEAALTEMGVRFSIVEEPGQDGDRAELRRIMTDPATTLAPGDKNMVRTLLMAADRVMNAERIRTDLANGITVLASRSFMSSVVYQGIIGGQLDLVTEIHQKANLPFPDIIFVIKVSGETSVKRTMGRGALDDIEKQVRLRADEYASAYDYAEAFVRHITKGKTRVIYLDGEASREDVFAHAMAHIKEQLEWS
ncbi:thymidylate kinase [Salmonella phage vB_SalM_SA002]|nr:thymidylate kinase [Salmonella phage vB_SalM_SA002]